MEQVSVEKQFAKLLIAIRRIRPFYASVFEVIDKRPIIGYGTVGVTENELVYDPIFIQTTEFSELLFVMLHEIAHIALQHVSRRENRDTNLWNIAADLYVNATLSKEFKIARPGDTVNINGYDIKAPILAYYCDSIDIDKDYVEKIYYSLYEQGDKNGYNSSSDDSYSYSFSYTGSGNGGSFTKTVSKAEVSQELIESTDGTSGKYKADKVIAEAITRSDMSSDNISVGTSDLLTKVRKLLESELDWKKLLKKYLRKSTERDISYKTPDRRMFYQKIIYPGQSQAELNCIDSVKICIDTSGSISNEDLGYIFGQINKLLTQYKISAELIYWDSEVKSAGKFTKYTEFERIDCIGGGGTDPSCVFEYIKNKKDKPIVTLIFTDGYFFNNWYKDEYKRKFKDTIWVMTKNYNREFKPQFGKLSVAKFK